MLRIEASFVSILEKIAMRHLRTVMARFVVFRVLKLIEADSFRFGLGGLRSWSQGWRGLNVPGP